MSAPAPVAGAPEASRTEALRRDLANFRARHPSRRFTAGGVDWTYRRAGSDGPALLILPGALGATFAFPIVERLVDSFRVLLPVYPRTREMAELVAGLAALLDQEGVPQAHLLGGSFGGLVAQAFVRRCPERTTSLVLSHTVAPDLRLAGRNAWGFRVAEKLPEAWLKALFRRKLEKAFSSVPGPEREFWHALLREEVDGMSKADLLDRARLTSGWMKEARFAPDDLSAWRGRVLIVESSGDPFVKPTSRLALRDLYPSAVVHRFEGTGHSSSLVKPEEFVSVVAAFLRSGGGAAQA